MSPNYFALGALLDGAGDDSGDDAMGEIVGALLSSGDEGAGDDAMGEIVGALLSGDDAAGGRRRGMHGLKARLAKAALKRDLGFRPRAVDFQNFKGKTVRRFPLGFLAAVGAGLTVDVTNRPQRPFRPEKITIPSTIGQFFGIVDFTIGNVPQTVSRGEVPALMFAENAIDAMIGADTGYISQDIVFTVRNKDGISHNFEAGILGTMIAGLDTPSEVFPRKGKRLCFLLDSFSPVSRVKKTEKRRARYCAFCSML